MFNSSILDVIIGLVFCFASVALFVSSINEALASLLKLRHKTLLAGIQKMLNDPDGNGLVRTLYAHALINPMTLEMPPAAAVTRSVGTPGPSPAAAANAPPPVTVKPMLPSWAKGQQIPAYIASKDFAHALIDIIQTTPAATADLQADIAKVADPQLRQALQGFFDRAKGDVDQFSDAIANWFDNAMDRLSGSYKRQAQAWTLVIALITAAGLNIDAIYVLKQLWQRPELSAAIVSPASQQLIAAAASQIHPPDATGAAPTGTVSADDMMKTLNTLPVGWGLKRSAPAEMWAMIYFYAAWVLGVFITASAAVFGAPFWFDLLQQLIQIRGTGAKPATNVDKKKPA